MVVADNVEVYAESEELEARRLKRERRRFCLTAAAAVTIVVIVVMLAILLNRDNSAQAAIPGFQGPAMNTTEFASGKPQIALP